MVQLGLLFGFTAGPHRRRVAFGLGRSRAAGPVGRTEASRLLLAGDRRTPDQPGEELCGWGDAAAALRGRGRTAAAAAAGRGRGGGWRGHDWCESHLQIYKISSRLPEPGKVTEYLYVTLVSTRLGRFQPYIWR